MQKRNCAVIGIKKHLRNEQWHPGDDTFFEWQIFELFTALSISGGFFIQFYGFNKVLMDGKGSGMNSFLRFQEVMKVMAMSRSTVYLRVKQGLLTQPVRIGERCTVWPENEISAINSARLALKTNDEIRELVKQLQQKRPKRD